jgi:hypothetical protein
MVDETHSAHSARGGGYPALRPYIADRLHDRAVESGQLSAGVAALKEMGILSGKRIERQEVGGPGEYDALNDDDLERQVMERVARFERGTWNGGGTQH